MRFAFAALVLAAAIAALPRAADPLFQAANMKYEGAFKVPVGTTLNGQPCRGSDLCTGNWGGTAIGFDAAGNDGKGSLFFAALDSGQPPSVGEISVSTDLTGGAIDPGHTQLSQMPTAKLLQEFGDVFGGHADEVSPGANNGVGGLFPVTYAGEPRLLASMYNSFGVASTSRSHFILAKTIATPSVIVGPVEVNGLGTAGKGCTGGRDCPDGWVAGSHAAIPPAYQAALGGDMLSGLCCVSIIGRTSMGPTATRWKLADLAKNPVNGKRLLGYPDTHPTLGKWTTGSDGGTSPPGASGGTGQFTSQNDLNRMVWPTGYRSLLFFYVLGNAKANCYGAPVAAGDGDPVINAIGEEDGHGADASTNDNGTTVTLPNFNVNKIAMNAGHGYIWLADQKTPAISVAGRNYLGMAKILSVSKSGTPGASVTVDKREAFPANLTGQNYRIGAPACYDPAGHGTAIPDNVPKQGHGPSAYPYRAIVAAYDANDLAAVNAGKKNAWDPVPYATWDLKLPVAYPAGKHAIVSLGSAALDPVRHKMYVTQRFTDAAAQTIVLQYGFDPGTPGAGLPAGYGFLLGAAAALGVALICSRKYP